MNDIVEKGIMHYDDACSRTSNEEDSLLSASSSPNITSPSSTSALSGSGSSLDEGVDMGAVDEHNADLCKRMLFESCVRKFPRSTPRPSPQSEDLPIDLSMKKNQKQPSLVLPASENKPREMAHYYHQESRRESGELIIDEDTQGSARNTPEPEMFSRNSDKIETPANQVDSSAPKMLASQFAPTYLPWSYVPGSNVPFASSALSTFWHPALLMSQAAKHFAPSLTGLPGVPLSTTGAPGIMPTHTTDALKHMYGHNVLAEFSRICSQAQHLYGSHVLPENAATLNATAGTRASPTVLSASTERRSSHSPGQDRRFEQYTGITVKQEAPSPSRKRKHDGLSPTSVFSRDSNSPSGTERQISPPVGKRIREEYHRGVFDHTASNEAPPTMVQSSYNAIPAMVTPEHEENRLVPKPVDFKPCRFPCNECGRTYATVGGLMKHAKTHHDPVNASNFKCKTCEKEYNSLGALKMHIRTHTLPCKCHICGKAFSRTWLLQGHIRTHTGEKPYQCSVCSRAFADRSNLRAHMQTHESVKRYACTSCDKTFSRISLLNRHHVSGCAGSS